MELNKEEILKDLQRLVDKYGENGSYNTYCTLSDSLALIKELSEENFLLKQKRANIFEIVNAYERGRAEAYKKFAEEYKDQIKNYTGIFTDDDFYVSLQAILSAVDFIRDKLVGD